MISATIRSKGQITIPKTVRNSLMLQAGDKVEFIVTEKKEAIIRPLSRRVDEVYGMLHQQDKEPVTVEEINAKISERMKTYYR